MQKAVNEVIVHKKKTLREACQKFAVPKSTIQRTIV